MAPMLNTQRLQLKFPILFFPQSSPLLSVHHTFILSEVVFLLTLVLGIDIDRRHGVIVKFLKMSHILPSISGSFVCFFCKIFPFLRFQVESCTLSTTDGCPLCSILQFRHPIPVSRILVLHLFMHACYNEHSYTALLELTFFWVQGTGTSLFPPVNWCHCSKVAVCTTPDTPCRTVHCREATPTSGSG